jgi:hypothetical protein
MVAVKEKGLERLLVDDWYLRRPLTDHFLTEGTTLENFMATRYHEMGDFILEPFETSVDEDDKEYRVSMTRQGNVWHGDFHCPVKMEKIITFPKRGHIMEIEYRLVQNDLEIMPVQFGVEFDFNLQTPDAEDRYAEIDGSRPKEYHLGAVAEASQVSSIAYIDDYQKLGIRITADRPGKLWRMPINTVSLSEGGFEKAFQGNCTMFLFDKALSRGEEFRVRFEMFTGPLEKMPRINNSQKAAANKL